MFEFALSAWGADPVTIRKTWSHELLELMTRKAAERIKAQQGGGDKGGLSYERIMEMAEGADG